MDYIIEAKPEELVDIERIIKEYGDSLLRMCMIYLKDRALAEDAVQDTFIKVYQKYHTFNKDSEEKTWIMKIAINTCKNYMRTSWFKRVKTGLDLETVSEEKVDVNLLEQEAQKQILQEVAELNYKYKEVFKAHGIVLDTIDYHYASNSKGLYMKLDRMLKKEIGSTQRQTLKENPKVTFEYVGMIKDSRLEDPYNPDGGLTLYTRNESDKYWTDSSDNYTVGTISEVTDMRTGKVYEATTRAIEYDIDTLWRGALGISQFMDLMDPNAIPYLKATKITYEVQEVVEEAEWKVKFEVADTTTTKPIMADLSFVEESESVTVKEIEYSVLGITMKATREVRDEDPLKLSIHDKMVLELRMKDGSIMPLQCKVASGTQEHVIASYILEDEHGDPAFVDVDQLEAIIINGEEVMVP